MSSSSQSIIFPPDNYNPCNHPYSLGDEKNFDLSLLKIITKCYSFASQKHKHQTRKSDGSSYIIHPNGVADMLTHIGGIKNYEIICGAILHDTIEDTDCTAQEIAKEFGNSIASYVMEVSDDKSMNKIERKKHQIDHCTQLSFGAILIKYADKFDNLSSLTKDPPKLWSPKRCQGYFLWAKTIVDKIYSSIQSKLSKNSLSPNEKSYLPSIEKLYQSLHKIFKGTFSHSNKTFDCIDPNMTLQYYYTILKKSHDYQLEKLENTTSKKLENTTSKKFEIISSGSIN